MSRIQLGLYQGCDWAGASEPNPERLLARPPSLQLVVRSRFSSILLAFPAATGSLSQSSFRSFLLFPVPYMRFPGFLRFLACFPADMIPLGDLRDLASPQTVMTPHGSQGTCIYIPRYPLDRSHWTDCRPPSPQKPHGATSTAGPQLRPTASVPSAPPRPPQCQWSPFPVSVITSSVQTLTAFPGHSLLGFLLCLFLSPLRAAAPEGCLK